MNTENQADSAVALAAKVGPPVSISLATIAGYSVSELVMWATLIYTLLMIGHKAYQIWRDVKEGKRRGRSKS